MEEEKKPDPSYFAFITGNVRYDKDLKPNEKLLFAEITSLANKHGFCWAGNNYFAEHFNTAPETISRWISRLIEKGYIFSEVDKSSGNKRRIYLSETLLTKKSIAIDEKVMTPIDEKVKHNNIINNTIKDNISSPSQAQEDNAPKFVKDLVVTKDSTKEERIIKRFHSFFCQHRTKPEKPFNHKVLLGAKVADWKKDLDLMMRVDKRTREDLLGVYEFISKSSDPFWRDTILSLGGIRKHFDQISDKMDAEKNKIKQSAPEAPKEGVFQGNIKRVSK